MMVQCELRYIYFLVAKTMPVDKEGPERLRWREFGIRGVNETEFG